jgi:hypothetical protein
MDEKEASNMINDKYVGIRRALELAKLTGQSVNVGLNRGGEGVKIEGIITAVYDYKFHIHLETGEKEIVNMSEVEYVEYS